MLQGLKLGKKSIGQPTEYFFRLLLENPGGIVPARPSVSGRPACGGPLLRPQLLLVLLGFGDSFGLFGGSRGGSHGGSRGGAAAAAARARRRRGYDSVRFGVFLGASFRCVSGGRVSVCFVGLRFGVFLGPAIRCASWGCASVCLLGLRFGVFLGAVFRCVSWGYDSAC